MNFYSIKIGKETRKGGFIEHHSFVCKTDNANVNDVKTHWQKHYIGLDVQASEVVEIVESEVKESFSFGKEEKKEVRELKKEISSLKAQLRPKKTERFFSSVESCYFPRAVKENIEIIKENEAINRKLKKDSSEIITNMIVDDNSKICQWARGDKGFSENYSSFSYELLLKGNLVKDYETEN